MEIPKFKAGRKQQEDIIFLCFSPEIISASKSNLEKILTLLNQHKPSKDNLWNKGDTKALNNEGLMYPKWLTTHDKVSELLKEKNQEIRHYQTYKVAIYSLFALLVTTFVSLGMQAYTHYKLGQKVDLLEKQSKELYQAFCSTYPTTSNPPSSNTANNIKQVLPAINSPKAALNK